MLIVTRKRAQMSPKSKAIVACLVRNDKITNDTTLQTPLGSWSQVRATFVMISTPEVIFVK
jgi:hypothetical protein